MTEPALVENNPKGSPETSIASTLIPWDRDDERALYFGYRSSGLSVRETLHMLKRSKSWLSLQRKDPEFVDLEKRIPEFWDELSKEYIKLETFRNFRFVLEKDRRILEKALKTGKIDKDGMPISLTKHEQEYLIKLRTMYTPAQIQILEALAGKDSGWNFASWVAEHPDIVQMSRTDTVTMARGGDGQS